MSSTAVTLEVGEGVAVITASGEIDMASAPQLVERAGEIPHDVPRVVVDLREVTFLDSSGLGALIACQKRVGSLTVVVSQPRIAKLFDITGLREVIRTSDSLAEALAPEAE
jgi:anti-sigma B factor antagonist